MYQINTFLIGETLILPVSNYAKIQNDGLYWPKADYKSLYFANYTETVKKISVILFNIT